MRLKIGHLRLVDAIASEGTLTSAAKRLHISQPALSRQLSALERRLATRLFDRSRAGMKITPAGQRLLEQGRPLLARVRDLEEDLESLARGDAASIRVTTQCHTSYRWLASVLPRFREEYPEVDIRIVPEAASDPLAAVRDREVDVALAYDVAWSSDRLVATPLFDDELVLLVPLTHAYSDREFVTASDFADQHLLAYASDPNDSWFYKSVLRPASVAPRRLSGVRLTEGIVSLVAAGVGIAVLTRWTAAPEIAGGSVRAVRIGATGLWRPWAAVMLKETQERACVRSFVAAAKTGPARLSEAQFAPRTTAALRVLP